MEEKEATPKPIGVFDNGTIGILENEPLGICPKCEEKVNRTLKQCPFCNTLLFFEDDSAEERIKNNAKRSVTYLLVHEQEFLFEEILSNKKIGRILLCFPAFLLFSALYGFVWGCHENLMSGYGMALKVPLILLSTLAVSLPLFFILNIIIGASLSLLQSFLVLILVNYLIGMTLFSVTPIMALFIFYPDSTGFLQILNLILFALSSFIGLLFLWGAMDYWQVRAGGSASCSWLVKVWSGLYCFISIQLAWTAKLFGDLSQVPLFKQLNLEGNFYMVLYQIIEKFIE